MSKKFNPFWRKSKTSIQEPSPHHTVLCKNCGYLYNRRSATSRKCPRCGAEYDSIEKTEFYVSTGKKKIFTGNNLETKRRLFR